MEDLSPGLHRLVEQMGRIDEPALAVLKGQLLLEEQLDRILTRFVFHPEHLEQANLRFYQKVCVARSISLDEQVNPMWELVLAVNALRNELAHSLDSPRRQPKVERLK